MSVFGPIPLKAGFTSMGELAELMLKKRALQAEQPLQQAKAREANMMANLYAAASGLPMPQEQQPEPSILQKIMNMFHGNDEDQQQIKAQANQPMIQSMPQPMNQPYQLSPEDQQRSSQIQPGESLVVGQPNPNAGQMNRKQLVDAANQGTDFFQRRQEAQSQANAQQPQGISSGLPQTPQAKRARQILQGLGKWDETAEEKEAREIRTSASTEWTKSDIKQVEGWSNTIDANRQIEPNLQLMEDTLATPEAQRLFSHPEFFGWDLAYTKRFGSPEDVDIITKMNTAGKDLFTTVGAQFKGPFRKFEFNLLNEAFPTQNDTFAQKYSKLTTLKAMKGIITDSLTDASEIVRSSNGSISPNKALEMAMEKNNVEERMIKVRKEFDEKMKEATLRKKEFEKNHKEGIPNAPKFSSQEEFASWFKRQPLNIQKSYRSKVEKGEI